MDKLIHIGVEDNLWSSAFLIDAMEDFQINFECTEVEKHLADHELNLRSQESKMSLKPGLGMLKRAVKVKKMKRKWYVPDVQNDYMHSARVVITSDDDATIFVNFLLPKDPEIILIN